jgi:hypothetical protein
MYFIKTGDHMKKLFCGVLFFVNILFAFAENTVSENKTNELKYLFSLDTSYTMIALQYSGFGLGVSFEYKLTNFLSIKYLFGQIACFSSITVITIDQQLYLYYYPLNNGLDKLYIGLGNGGNLFMYPNYPNKGNVSNDAAISITSILGWKWRVLKYLMIDPFIGWQFNIKLTNNYEKFNSYLNDGFQWGINFKILLLNKNN